MEYKTPNFPFPVPIPVPNADESIGNEFKNATDSNAAENASVVEETQYPLFYGCLITFIIGFAIAKVSQGFCVDKYGEINPVLVVIFVASFVTALIFGVKAILLLAKQLFFISERLDEIKTKLSEKQSISQDWLENAKEQKELIRLIAVILKRASK